MFATCVRRCVGFAVRMSRLVDESTNGHPMAARDRPSWSLQTNNEQEGGKITEGLAEKAAKIKNV